jgi:hypothetical protein
MPTMGVRDTRRRLATGEACFVVIVTFLGYENQYGSD